MLFSAQSIVTQVFSCLTAVAVALGGLVTGIFGVPDDTLENYTDRLSAVSLYENTIDTAVPQTLVAQIVNEHFHSALPQGKTLKKAIIIGYDGGRADALGCLDGTGAVKSMTANGAKAYIAYCGGASYPAPIIQATSTAPGWCSILTGVWADTHEVTDNGIPKSNENLTLLTTLVESGAASSSAFYTMWGGHFVDENSTYLNEKKYCEDKGLDVTFSKGAFDFPVYSRTMSDVRSDECSDIIFTILEGPDFTGHGFGFSPEKQPYKLGFKLDDSMAKRLIDEIENRDTYDTEDWLIILASDHGGFDRGHGGEEIQARMTFIITNKELLTNV